MIEWEIDEIVKRQFGFNFFILTAWKTIDKKRTGEYCFLFVDRKRLDKIFVALIDSSGDMNVNLKDIKDFTNLFFGICWINTQKHIGIFAPTKDNKRQINEAIKIDVTFYKIRDFFYRHSECLTFWGVVTTFFALLWSVCFGPIFK